MTYAGIFIRQNVGQQPNVPAQGSSNCPDIILEGLSDQGPAFWEDVNNYASMSSNDVWFNQPNFVYLRGYQVGTTLGTNMWFYTVPASLALWPKNWSSDNITVYGSHGEGNHAWAPPQNGSPIVVNADALVWTPATIDTGSGNHYCTIAWADNSTEDNPIPPPFDSWGDIQSFDDLMVLLASHPNMGWRNTNDFPTQPPDNQYSTQMLTLDNPETWYVTVNFSGMPPDGTFRVEVSGDVTYDSGDCSIGSYLGGYQINQGNGLPFDANQKAQLIVTYYAGDTPPSPYSAITAELDHYVTSLMVDRLAAIAAPRTVLPLQLVAMPSGPPRQKFLLGRQQWNLKWGTGSAVR